MYAWFWAGVGCVSAYTIVRIQGLLAGDFLYNPDTLPTAPIPYFRWILYSAWAALIFGVCAFWMVHPSEDGSSSRSLARWGSRWLWFMALLVALGQIFLIHHWKMSNG